MIFLSSYEAWDNSSLNFSKSSDGAVFHPGFKMTNSSFISGMELAG